MRIDDSGCTRVVLVFESYVLKIPRFTYSWSHFLKGLLANMQERDCWKWNSGKYEKGDSHLLCPVIWGSWGGWLLIMKRADVKRHLDEVYKEKRKYCYATIINAGFGGDDKPENYGYLNNKLVKVDYGSQ